MPTQLTGRLWVVHADVPLDRYGPGPLEASLKDFDWVSRIALAHEAVVGGRVCLYENTPDRHFIIDWAPETRRGFIAGGGSGHGFKVGGLVGPVIADRLEEGI